MMRSLAAALICVCPIAASAGEWLTSYSQAYEDSKKADKPIFVYFTNTGSHADWKASFDGKNELTDRYVTVVADKNTKEGAEIYKTFDMSGDSGAVVIDRGREWQYFRTSRELNSDDLSKVLTECKDAKGKPAASVLTNVSSAVEESTPTTINTMPSSNYCPNCRRFR